MYSPDSEQISLGVKSTVSKAITEVKIRDVSDLENAVLENSGKKMILVSMVPRDTMNSQSSMVHTESLSFEADFTSTFVRAGGVNHSAKIFGDLSLELFGTSCRGVVVSWF